MTRGNVKHIGAEHVQGGNVPGGHCVLVDADDTRKPFITPMTECNSIPLRPSDVVIDIGAYTGTYAVRCARFPVQSVYAYEPTPITLDVLRRNAGQLPNLTVVPAAVVSDAHQGDTIDLFISAGIGVTNSTVQYLRKKSVRTVPAVRYSDAVRGASIVKIDIEGGEYTLPIVQPHLRALIIDFHPVANYDWQHAAAHMIADIKDAGFETVIEPDFSNGWTRAGSWSRHRPTSGHCDVLMRGEQCCGCGVLLLPPVGHKALCETCIPQWSARHLREFGYDVKGKVIRWVG